MEATIEKTRFHTKVIQKRNFLLSIESCAKDFIEHFQAQRKFSQNMLPVNICDGFELINFVAIENAWPDIIRKLYMQCFIVSEKNRKCSGLIATYVFSKLIINESCVREKYNTTQDLCAVKCTKNDAFKSLKFFIDDNIFDFIKDVISNVGVDGSISIENTRSNIPTLEFSAGHSFNIGLHQHFANEKIKVESAKVLLFDGAVQEVSQIDHIFTQASEKKCAIILVARSFGDDIISTINVNSKRNTLHVFPVVIKDELTNINCFFDIAVCTGGSVITADTGKRLSTVNVEDLQDVNQVALSKVKTKFGSNPLQKAAIAKKIEKIKDRIDHAHWEDEMSAEDIRTVYTSRINSLSGNLIKLWVPGDDEYLNYVRRNFDFSLSYISSFANFGKVKPKDFLTGFNLPVHIPPDILEESIITGKKIYNDVRTIGSCIEIDR